ncbi:MAG: hypothetical protein GX951_03515 [Mollicutes bacterium]|nr:hypothetical protein [Mollicutes bacterium]
MKIGVISRLIPYNEEITPESYFEFANKSVIEQLDDSNLRLVIGTVSVSDLDGEVCEKINFNTLGSNNFVLGNIVEYDVNTGNVYLVNHDRILTDEEKATILNIIKSYEKRLEDCKKVYNDLCEHLCERCDMRFEVNSGDSYDDILRNSKECAESKAEEKELLIQIRILNNKIQEFELLLKTVKRELKIRDKDPHVRLRAVL